MNDMITINKLDQEWVELIKEARKLGIPIEDVREFLSEKNEY